MGTQEQTAKQLTISRDGERVLGNIHEAQTVLKVAHETWSDQHESFVGILDLLDHKLAMIHSATKSLLETAGVATHTQRTQVK